MQRLFDKGIITEMSCGSDFSYILSDNNFFLSTEYKVLQSQTNSCFVKCMKMLFNGKTQLYYLTNNLKSFASMIPTFDADSFLLVVSNILSDIIDVKHNGFLSCRNIDISFDKIFVDPATYKVSLIYLPISERIYADIPTFENELRTGFVKLISGVSSISSPKTIQFCADLSNGALSIEELHNRVKGGKGQVGSVFSSPGKMKSGMRMVAINAPFRVEIAITKNEFLIGKKADMVDGVISFNNMISRLHCKVCQQGQQYTIMDLQSANGTYINKVKLPPNKAFVIKNGDIVRLANSDFQVVIG